MNLIASYTGTEKSWTGVIKMDGKIIWKCPHRHTNRNQSTGLNGRSACDCATGVLCVSKMDDSKFESFMKSKNYMNGFGYAHKPNPALDKFNEEQRVIVRGIISPA